MSDGSKESESELIDIPLTDLLSYNDRDYSHIITNQHIELISIQEKISSRFRLILAMVSLIFSIGLVRLIFAPEVLNTPWKMPDTLANRCLPNSLTMENGSLHGIGLLTLLILFGITILIAVFVIEVWNYHEDSQNLPSIESLRNGQDQMMASIIESAMLIEVGRAYLERVNHRFEYIIILILSMATLIVLSLGNEGLFVLIVDIMILVAGLLVLFVWVFNISRGKGKIRDPKIDGRIPFHLVSVPVLILFEIISLWWLTKIWSVLSYFTFC